MKGVDVISAVKKKLGVSTDRALADRLGITTQAIHNWKNRGKVTERQVAGLLSIAMKASAKDTQVTAIRPLVEFFRVEKCLSKQGARFEIFSTQDTDGKQSPYHSGLRDELEVHHGVYIFFDSRGQAIYAGKARLQNLWKEINLAFNRKRGDVQKIKRVSHPTRKQAYRNSNEKARQITDHVIPLHEIAAYFSAYLVSDGLIGEVEAMLVRSFANDLLNVRMERFGHQRQVRKRSKAGKV